MPHHHPGRGPSFAGLRPFRALPRPDAPGTPLLAPVLCTVRRDLLSVHNKHNARRHDHPLVGDPGPSGVGLCVTRARPVTLSNEHLARAQGRAPACMAYRSGAMRHSRVGVLRGSGLYNALTAALTPITLARPSLCPQPTGLRPFRYHAWRGNPSGGGGEGSSAR